jgi:hypothetical protein
MSDFFRKRVTIEEWLDAAGKNTEKGVLSAINCYHMMHGRESWVKGDEVAGIQFAQGKAWSPKEVADQIRGQAEVYSQDLRGIQTFKIFAYYGQAESSAFFHFEVTGRTAHEHGETEGADERGMRGQGQRLLELAFQTTYKERQETWNMMKHLAAEMKAQLDDMRDRALDAEGNVIKLIQQKIQDNNEHDMRVREFMRSTEERKKLILLLPAIINRITGKQLISDNAADTSILEAVAQHLRTMPKEKQQEALGMMPTELVMILGGRLKEISDRQEAEESALRLLAEANKGDAKSHDMILASEAGTDTPPETH